MKRKLCIPNLLMILLLLIYFLLATYSLYLLLSASLTVFQSSEASTHSAIIAAIIGSLFILPQIIVTVILSKQKNLTAFFQFTIIYFAFMPIVDFNTLLHLFDGHNLLLVDFSLVNNLQLLTKFPKELVLILVLLILVLCQHKYNIKTWQIILCLISLFLGIGLLFLPQLSEILLFILIYILSYLAFGIYEQFLTSSKGTEKIFFHILLALFAGRGLYRMISILYAYAYLS